MATARITSARTRWRWRRWTQRIAYLDEGDWAVVRRDEHPDLRPRERARSSARSSNPARRRRAVEKGNYRHYMQKEIFEQPIVVAQTLQSYVRPFEGEVALPTGDLDLSAIGRVTIVACGTSFYAGMVAKYWIEQFARVPVDIDVASEFRYRQPVLEPGGLALFISQSGETADTLAALRHARSEKQRIAVVVERADQLDGARGGPAASDACRAGNRRRLDQGLHLPARGARRARPQTSPARRAG